MCINYHIFGKFHVLGVAEGKMSFFRCKKYEAQEVLKNTRRNITLRKEFPTEVGPCHCFVKQRNDLSFRLFSPPRRFETF